jgi:hypothetical protein
VFENLDPHGTCLNDLVAQPDDLQRTPPSRAPCTTEIRVRPTGKPLPLILADGNCSPAIGTPLRVWQNEAAIACLDGRVNLLDC